MSTISVDVTLGSLSECQKVVLEKELFRKNLKFAVTYDKIKRTAKYHVTLTAAGQKYLLPQPMKRALGM